MVGSIFGFFGSIIALAATIVAAAVGITLFIILWKSGALPELIGWGTALIVGIFGENGLISDFFGFLRDLIGFARS